MLKSPITTARKMIPRVPFVLALTAFAALALPANAATTVDPKVDAAVRALSQEMASICPIADAGDQRAFDSCRKQMFTESRFREILSPVTLWGRQRDPNVALRDTKLTQFEPDILSGLYASLFMFDGTYKVTFNERENLYLATLGVAFRNRLQPGQFPYPFWHESDKWGTYEDARSMLLWIDPQTGKARVAQFSRIGDRQQSSATMRATMPNFDGKWLWTDNEGKTQPAVTLFDGLFRSSNPYKEQLSATYREFAVSLRDSQCLSCHVPNNPNSIKKLVLLQSPAHAANDIKRVLKEVKRDSMPVDDYGMEKSLDPTMKKVLLEKGGEFDRVVDLARAWERTQNIAERKDPLKSGDAVSATETRSPALQ